MKNGSVTSMHVNIESTSEARRAVSERVRRVMRRHELLGRVEHASDNIENGAMFCKALSDVMVEFELSCPKLAKRFEVTPSTIRAWLKGETLPTAMVRRVVLNHLDWIVSTGQSR